MEKVHFISLLERFHKRQLSKKELIELFDWINSEEGEAEYDCYLSEQTDVLDSPEADTEQMLRMVRKKIRPRRIHVLQWTEMRKYVAILIIAMGTGSLLWLMTGKHEKTEKDTVFAVSKGNKAELTLADGSEIWLNAESRITYTASAKRQIRLEGEAFLQVAKDKECPFVVHTEYTDIVVYGTQFSVTAFPEDSTVNVSLIEGSVGIRIMGQDNITQIIPGQTAHFNSRNNRLEITSEDMSYAALWRNEELSVENADASELFGKMKAWYGVHIAVTKQPRKTHLYNLTVRQETLEEMLELINRVTPIEYRIKGKEVTVEYVSKSKWKKHENGRDI
jgi:ferric-dicitrate binding protein FerR (iron transport regulator)